MNSNVEYVRAYASRYRDMFPVRIATIIGIVAAAWWLMDWTWAANFAVCQLGLYALLWRVVEGIRKRPEAPGAGVRLTRFTEVITFGLALHTALFVLAGWRTEPAYLFHLLLLIGGNLMVGALQVHISRISFAAAVMPPAVCIAVIALGEASWDKMLLTTTALFVVSVVGAAWRQAATDRQTVELFVELKDALARAEIDRAAADHANRAKSRFLAMISHEVRTPLNVILGIAEVLKRRRRTRAEAALVADMADAGGMLLRLLNGALDLSKIESGEAEARLAPVDVRESLYVIARVWRSRVEDLGLTLIVDCEGADADFRLVTDGAKIEQTVINLLSNALKLTPRGTIRILARARLTADGAVSLHVEVHDQGPGVPEDQRESIFQPFEQLAAGQAAGGAGLGLAICRANIASLDGRIGMRPAEPSGAVFWFEIPAARAPVAGVSPANAAPDTAAERRLTVLAAEDHAANRKLLALLLEPFDIDLKLVEDGRQAVAAAAARSYDLILMDVMMPVMDGVAALAEIRSAEHETGRARTPVRMLTANVFDEDVARYIAAGADGVLRKPIEIDALHRALADTASRLNDGPEATRLAV